MFAAMRQPPQICRIAAGKRGEIIRIIGASAVLQQLRQLGDVGGDAPRLVAGEAALVAANVRQPSKLSRYIR